MGPLKATNQSTVNFRGGAGVNAQKNKTEHLLSNGPCQIERPVLWNNKENYNKSRQMGIQLNGDLFAHFVPFMEGEDKGLN